MLTDTTSLGQMQFNQVRINTEMRDVALAAMILLSGQNVQEYEFPYIKAVRINQQYLAYNYFGFSDNASAGRNLEEVQGVTG